MTKKHLNLPEESHKKLKQLARKTNRTMIGMLTQIIEEKYTKTLTKEE
jgi:predicted DNA-binding protein